MSGQVVLVLGREAVDTRPVLDALRQLGVEVMACEVPEQAASVGRMVAVAMPAAALPSWLPVSERVVCVMRCGPGADRSRYLVQVLEHAPADALLLPHEGWAEAARDQVEALADHVGLATAELPVPVVDGPVVGDGSDDASPALRIAEALLAGRRGLLGEVVGAPGLRAALLAGLTEGTGGSDALIRALDRAEGRVADLRSALAVAEQERRQGQKPSSRGDDAALKQAEADAARERAEAQEARAQAEAEVARMRAEMEAAREQAKGDVARAKAEAKAARQQVKAAVERVRAEIMGSARWRLGSALIGPPQRLARGFRRGAAKPAAERD